MNDLDRAMAAARQALAKYWDGDEMSGIGAAVDDLLAALDAAQGEAVAWRCTGDEIRCFDGNGCECAMLGKAPPTADAALADTQRAIIEAAERRGYERGLREAPPAAVPEDAWMKLYRRAMNVAGGLTNYIEHHRPGLRDAERELDAIERDARALLAAARKGE